MWSKEIDARWQDEAEEVMTGVRDWRVQHPRATFREIEAAVDERLAKMRARMLQDAAMASAVAQIGEASVEERPSCSQCGHMLRARGEEERTLTTSHNQAITLKRSYAVCPACGAGLFPPG